MYTNIPIIYTFLLWPKIIGTTIISCQDGMVTEFNAYCTLNLGYCENPKTLEL